MLKAKWFLILFFLPGIIWGQKVSLEGNIPEYAGETITFLTFSDQIAFTEKVLCNAIVNEDGSFSCSFETNETIYVFTHIGIYDAFFYAESGKEYQLLFPERKDKTIGDKLNPYFKPVQYHLGIENSDKYELNYQIAFFDEIYLSIVNQGFDVTYEKFMEQRSGNNKAQVDSVLPDGTYTKIIENTTYTIPDNLKQIDFEKEISKIDSFFAYVDNKFFHDYKTYQLASFRYLANQEKSKSISDNYFLNQDILYHNPAYMGLFNQVYKDYFNYFGRTEEGKKIFSDISFLKSITALKNTLGQDSVLTNNQLKELVILKCLYDEFYDDKLSRSAMLTVLDSLILQTGYPEHQLIGENIRHKVTKLMVGFEPPAFELLDQQGNLVSLQSFQGKYVYLSFCASYSYGCIKEFEMLRTLYQNHKNHFEIVVICMDDSLEQMKSFVERKGYPFKFLFYGNQPDIFKEYDIRAFPTYYFIDKNGKLVLSPAPSPDQNAEFSIFKIMRANGDI